MLDRFSPPTAEWFRSSFAAPTKAQVGGWEAIGSGANTLIHAPTGSGKTLAAFLWTIDRLFTEPVPPDAARCRVLYVSPLKALAHDIERNLRAPLQGIRHAAERAGLADLPSLTTFVRTGDTPEEERRQMRRHPPDILITTPESLHLVLTSQARMILGAVRWVIVDEVHAVAGTKRGAHLALSLERLEELRRTAVEEQAAATDAAGGTGEVAPDAAGPVPGAGGPVSDVGGPASGVGGPAPGTDRATGMGRGAPEAEARGSFQRIGLSATQRPLETIARFLGGGEIAGASGAAHGGAPGTAVDGDAAGAGVGGAAGTALDGGAAGTTGDGGAAGTALDGGAAGTTGDGGAGETAAVRPAGTWVPRPVVVVDAHAEPHLDLELTVPVADMTAPTDDLLALDVGTTDRAAAGSDDSGGDDPGGDDPGSTPAETATDDIPAGGAAGDGGSAGPAARAPVAVASDPEETGPRSSRGTIWSAIHPRILDLIRQHTSTIVFVNSRRLAERLSAELNELAGEDITRSHHGSVSREQRIQIEEGLKRGQLKAVVATSSLELGIDMGAVDLVIQVESPVSVASGLQRVGRAGHQVFEVSRARLVPKHRGDLLVSAVVGKMMTEGAVEETRIPRHPLDVLAQQLVATVVTADQTSAELYDMVRRAAPYAELPRSAFDATLDMLAGRYPSDAFAELRPRVVWDRLTDTVTARPGARALVVTNAGTIPDRGLYRVALPDGSRVGELDEEMVYESRKGDVFVLGSSTWRIAEITTDTVVVTPAPGEPAAQMPYWNGDQPGRPVDTGRAVGRFVREIGASPADAAAERLRSEYHLDAFAAGNLLAYLEEERAATGVLPSDQTMVVERFRDEIGDWRVVILSPLGARVHAPWAMALIRRLRSRLGYDVDAIWSDDGIAFRFPDADEVPSAADLELAPDEVEDLLVEHLADTALFAARFREAAGRSLLLPRRRPRSRTPLWLQRRRAAGLLAAAREFGSFPIVLECYREILQDDFDVPALLGVLEDIQRRRIRVVEVETPSASPFASSLLFAFVAAFLYEADTPLAERRAMALTLDRELLAELLGESELRELLSADVIAAVEQDLQRLTDERKATSVDDVADLLRHLGPLSVPDVAARCADPASSAGYVDDLVAARRAFVVRMGGEERVAAVEDISRLRDALGVQPPPGVPDVFLDPVDDPLGDVVGRYARTHGPFRIADAASSLGLPVAVAETTLRRLEATGRVVRGAFDPHGDDAEWADAEVLRRIKRWSLASLRGEIEPVVPEALARFLPGWHGISERPRSGAEAMLEVVHRLQGVPIPASVLESDVLAARVSDPAGALDALMAEGSVVWVGHGPLGARDGKVALYLRDQVDRLLRPPSGDEPSGAADTEVHAALLRHLGARGASFFRDLHRAAGADVDTTLDALWDLVWAGSVTNDTLAPVRALAGGARGRGRVHGRPASGARSAFPPRSAGRWSLVADLLDPDLTTTEYAAAWVDQLLERHGVLTRSAVLAEGLPGGFTGVYPVLAGLEEAGRVRRGYFVDGLGGAQFALAGAVGRLRASGDDTRDAAPGTMSGRLAGGGGAKGGAGSSASTAGGVRGGGVGGGPDIVTLAATDPANPYGATLDWPPAGPAGEGRLARVAGAHVLLAGGRLVAYSERGGRNLRRLDPDPALELPIAAALAGVAERVPRFTVVTVDDQPAADTSLAGALTEHGFVRTARGMRWRPRARR